MRSARFPSNPELVDPTEAKLNPSNKNTKTRLIVMRRVRAVYPAGLLAVNTVTDDPARGPRSDR
jgi:hypothetical protein